MRFSFLSSSFPFPFTQAKRALSGSEQKIQSPFLFGGIIHATIFPTVVP